MTRGYVCIKDGSKITDVAYLPSSAYLEHYGYKILRAVTKNELKNWISQQNSENKQYRMHDDCKGFSLSWIRKTKNADPNNNYEEYGYLYEKKTGVLKVYYYGLLLHKILPEERGKYLFFFLYATKIESVVTYIPEKYTYDWKHGDSIMKKLVKQSTIDELRTYVDSYDTPRPELKDEHLVMGEYHVYAKDFSVSGRPNYLRFVVEKEQNKWNVLIQTPYCKKTIMNGFHSEKAAVNHIRKIIHTTGWKKLIRLADIFKEIEETKHADKPYTPPKNGWKEWIQEKWKEEEWFDADNSFSPDKLTFVLSVLSQ